MGHGTGASLANILIVSPVASDLINRAILISGSALSPWAIQKDPLYVKRKVAEGTGCHGDLLDDDMAPCLRTKPLADLLSVTIDSPRYVAKNNIYFIIRNRYERIIDSVDFCRDIDIDFLSCWKASYTIVHPNIYLTLR